MKRARVLIGKALVGIGDVLISVGVRVQPPMPRYPGYSSNGELDDGITLSTEVPPGVPDFRSPFREPRGGHYTGP